MSECGTDTTRAGVLGQLSALDRLLPVLIFLAVAMGLALGAVAPGIRSLHNCI